MQLFPYGNPSKMNKTRPSLSLCEESAEHPPETSPWQIPNPLSAVYKKSAFPDGKADFNDRFINP
jgi:hypothetical protein